MGESYSGPLIVDGKVYVTETLDAKFEQVRAMQLADGKELWRARWEGAMSVPFFAKSNGDWIRATPAFDDGVLYVAGMRDVLVALQAADGKELWRIDFVKKFGSALPSFGFVSSPLILSDYVFVQAGGGLVKLHKKTGEVLWRVLDDGGGMNGSAFASPYFVELAGRQQLLVQTRTKLAGVDPADGAVLWSQEVPAFRGMNILTPTVFENGVFTSSYGGKSFLYEVSPGASGFQVGEAWSTPAQGYMSSPIIYEGHAYLHLRNQRFTCIDLSTGKETWRTKGFGKYWSLVASGDRILALDEQGELFLIHATPEKFDLLGRRQISSEPAWAHLAIQGDNLVIRELKATTAWKWSK